MVLILGHWYQFSQLFFQFFLISSLVLPVHYLIPIYWFFLVAILIICCYSYHCTLSCYPYPVLLFLFICSSPFLLLSLFFLTILIPFSLLSLPLRYHELLSPWQVNEQTPSHQENTMNKRSLCRWITWQVGKVTGRWDDGLTVTGKWQAGTQWQIGQLTDRQ